MSVRADEQIAYQVVWPCTRSDIIALHDEKMTPSPYAIAIAVAGVGLGMAWVCLGVFAHRCRVYLGVFAHRCRVYLGVLAHRCTCTYT